MTNKMIRTLGFVEVFDFNKKIKQSRLFVHPADLGRYFFLKHIQAAAGGCKEEE